MPPWSFFVKKKNLDPKENKISTSVNSKSTTPIHKDRVLSIFERQKIVLPPHKISKNENLKSTTRNTNSISTNATPISANRNKRATPISANRLLINILNEVCTKLFERNNNNNGITIEKENIPGEYFKDCTDLKKVIIGYLQIGKSSFEDCTGLTSITFLYPDKYNNYVIENNTFAGCSSLKSIEIPIRFYKIEKEAFKDCTSLSSIKIADSKIGNLGKMYGLLYIKEYAFYGCIQLKTINLPNSLKHIADHAFEKCSKLKEIIIPSNVTYIGKSAFEGCTVLQSVIFSDSKNDQPKNDQPKIINDSAFKGCSELTEIIIPSNVTYIGKSAFEGCIGLQSIIFSDSKNKEPKIINDSAFKDCSKLKEIKFDNSFYYIGASAFEKCIELTSVEIIYKYDYGYNTPNTPNKSKKLINICNYAFRDCSKLISMKMPKGPHIYDYQRVFDGTILEPIVRTDFKRSIFTGNPFVGVKR